MFEHAPRLETTSPKPKMRPQTLAPARLSFHVSTTFLFFFRTTTPQLSRNFRESSSHRPRHDSKGQVLSASFWRVLHFWRCFPHNRRKKSRFLRCGSGFLVREVRDFSRNWTLLSLETQNFARPYNTVARGSKALPATFVDFRPFVRPPQLSEKLSRKSCRGQSGPCIWVCCRSLRV